MIRKIVPVAVVTLLLAGCFSQAPAPIVDRSESSIARSTTNTQAGGPGHYTVKRGDTLYRIAQEHGQDYRDVAAWNGIALPAAAIKEGQVLRVVPPAASSDKGETVARPVTAAPVVDSRSLDAAPAAVPVAAGNGTLKREPRAGKEPYSDEAYARLNRLPEVVPVKPGEVKQESASASAASGMDESSWQWPVSGRVSGVFGEAGGKGIDIAGKLGEPVVASADGKVIYVGEAIPQLGKLIIVKHSETLNSVYAHNSKFLVKEADLVKRGQKIAEMGKSGTDTVKLHFEIRKQGKPVDPAQYLPKR